MSCTTLGIIPARGGSKGIPRKNIRMVAGKPLIAYTIDAAKESRLLTHFVVSTEDAEIAGVARSFGSEVIDRPAHLSADDTPMLPVIFHAINTLRDSGKGEFDIGVILQPTSPLRIASDIDRAIQIMVETGADSVVSVYPSTAHHPSKVYRLQDGLLVPFAPDPPGRLRQNMEPVFHRNGAIFAFRVEFLKQTGRIIGRNPRPVIMPRERSVDIDDELDLLFAEFILSLGGRRLPIA